MTEKMVLNESAEKTEKKNHFALNRVSVQLLRPKKKFFNAVSAHNLKTTQLILVKFYI
jgi:hypothetical protein